MRRRSFICVLLLLLSAACGDGASSPAANTWEYKLAAIQEQRKPPDAMLVGRIGAELDRLEPKCNESRERLSDFTVRTHDLMKEKGVDESHLSILSSVNAAIPQGAPRMPCADIFAGYLVLRTGGR